MKLIAPLYFKKFKCIASECTDSCCIGWDIPIDPSTLSRYRAVGGELGERLSDSIGIIDSEAEMRMCKNGRCPFLLDSGLCELICRLGDSYLSDICREHPRYYTVLGDTAYGGVGMSCEEAARLILTEPVGVYGEFELEGRESEECDAELYGVMLKLGRRVMDILSFEGSSLSNKLEALLDSCAEAQDEIDGVDTTYEKSLISSHGFDFISDFDALSERFLPLEYLSDELPSRIKAARSGQGKLDEGKKDYLLRVTGYLANRYLPRVAEEGCALGVAAMILSSVAITALLLSRLDDDSLSEAVKAVKLFSREIEYCEENVDALIYDSDPEELARAALGVIRAIE